jgi:hypothetical protein
MAPLLSWRGHAHRHNAAERSAIADAEITAATQALRVVLPRR